ncbi:hypothetical protein ACIQRC_01050 [Streptomyces californicus]|uniref:hypothetical protein n=1 Tax=Streptomyces californicus TaxID=67351 RepID=UPI0037FE6170
MKHERSSEENAAGDSGDAAPDGAAPGRAGGAAPGSIGAPSARTVTEGGDTAVDGGDEGGTRTPTSSASGPEEAGEREAEPPAVVHAVGVSIGRTPPGAGEEPEGAEAATAREEAAETTTTTAVAATTTTAPATVAAGETAETSASTASPAPPTAAQAEGPKATGDGATEPAVANTASGGPASRESSAETAGAGAATAAGTAATAAGTAASGATATAAVPAATAVTATAAAGPPDSATAAEGGAPERPGRVSRPMVVAAAFAGALLLGTPFVVAAAQKDDAEPTRTAVAAAWKQDGQEGGYVPGTDPASPNGIRAPGASEKGAPPVRGDKGPANHVRTDTGAGPHRADGAPGTKAEGAGDGKDSKGSKAAKGSTGTSGSTEKSGSGSKAPAASGSGGSAKAPATGTSPQSQPTTQPKSAPAVVYSGVSGPECPTQRFQRDGYYNDGKEGWATHSGGFGGYGCAGKYLSMPMSGSSSKDSGGSATWLFDLPDSARKCSISVHVPGSSDIVRVGGNPSHYTVYDRFLPRSNNLVGSFSVNQQSRRGTWYNVPGTFPVDAEKLSVRIHDRGQDSHYEHHAISAIKATCTG